MPRSIFVPLLYIFFFLSGATALIYEIIWEKYMALFLGAGAYSQAIVLSTFMLGLGVGSRVIGAYAERARDSLAIYSILEILIGLYALGFRYFIGFGEWIYVKFVSVDTPFLVVLTTKFFISFLTMLAPAIMMGGTLPVLSKFIIRRHDDSGRILSVLYFVNSVGAVAGCVAAGFYLIGRFGLVIPMIFGAATNILIGLIVYIFKNTIDGESTSPSLSSQTHSSTIHRTYSEREIRIFWTAAFLAGFAAMLYEVVWIRILSNVFGSTTYSFSMMLAVFIGGIALGSLFVSIFIDRIRDIPMAVIVLEILLIGVVGLTLPIYEKLPYYLHLISRSLVHNSSTFYVYIALTALLAAIVMMPMCFLSGMILPTLGLGTLTDVSDVGRKIGRIFAYNTFGTITAALGTGLFILPAVGTQRAIYLGLTVNAVIAIVVALILRNRRWVKGVAIALPCVMVTGIVITVPTFEPFVFLSSEFRHKDNRDYQSFDEYVNDLKDHYDILFHKEGITSTVIVTDEKGSGNRSLFINGKADASTSIDADLITQTLCGLIPHVLAPGSEEVLVIGMGTGTTAHIASQPDTVKRVDVVEIAREVVEAIPFFAEVNNNVNENPKVNIIVEDAKTYLNLNKNRYDIIISEPSNHWIAGIANLFSLEYYEQVYGTLEENGVFLQWLQAYETSDLIIGSILSTLRNTFPHIDIWSSGYQDLLISAYKKRPDHNFVNAGRDLLSDLRHSLEPARIVNVEEILIRHMANEIVVDPILKLYETIENSDGHPFIEYHSPKYLYTRDEAELPEFMDQRLQPKKMSKYPFFEALAGRKNKDFFAYYQNLHVKTPFTSRLRYLEVMYEDRWYIEDPWCRRYSLNVLPVYYRNATSAQNQSWYLQKLYEEYTQLTNCFVDVPFVDFLVKEAAEYLSRNPSDTEIAALYMELMRTESTSPLADQFEEIGK